jgi:tyrosinase
MATPLTLRPAVEQADIGALTDAYGKMQAIAPTDNRGWVYWAEYHGFDRYECWHGPRHDGTDYPYDLFLPWHRAYLTYWNSAAAAQNASAVVPWWDWTSDLSHRGGLPAAFTSDAADDPLASGPTPDMPGDPARRTQRSPSDPSQLPSMTESVGGNASIDSLMKLAHYEDFSNQLQDVHNFVHGWTGGDMGVIPVAAFDPIFWSHHTMIDRLWYLWQLRQGVSNIPPIYLDKTLEPFRFTVRQVLDIHALGYDYASSSASAAPAQEG